MPEPDTAKVARADRAGLRTLVIYLTPEKQRQIKVLAAGTGKSIQAIGDEMVTLYLDTVAKTRHSDPFLGMLPHHGANYPPIVTLSLTHQESADSVHPTATVAAPKMEIEQIDADDLGPGKLRNENWRPDLMELEPRK